MNYLDLFSGIGGFALAAQRAGIQTIKHYYSEVDKYAQQIYRKQFPGSIQLGDVTGIGNDLEKIDIITGGFPCQSFSIAGKRGGFSDTRGTLFFEIERLARFYRPSYMVLENVKGLFSHDGGNTIRVILDKLGRLNYSVQLLLLNTVDFGIPQNRERCFFICTAPGKRKPEISGIRSRKTEASGNDINKICYRYQNTREEYIKDSKVSTLNAFKGKLPYVEVGTLRTYKDGEGFRKMKSDICPTIPARVREDGSGQPIIKVQAIIRRLTPIECERLQDYPDNWTQTGIDVKGNFVNKISNTQRYKTLGNSITVKVAEEIFKTIKEAMNV